MPDKPIHTSPDDCFSIMVTDPTAEGSIYYKDELIIFATQSNDYKQTIVNDKYKVYFDGVLGERNIAQGLFTRKEK